MHVTTKIGYSCVYASMVAFLRATCIGTSAHAESCTITQNHARINCMKLPILHSVVAASFRGSFTPLLHQRRRTTTNLHEKPKVEMFHFAGIFEQSRTSTEERLCLHTAEDAGSIPASPTRKKCCFAGKNTECENWRRRLSRPFVDSSTPTRTNGGEQPRDVRAENAPFRTCS